MSSLFRVVIVGRPNVGKSTLFNRLCKKREAIVSPTAGMTRDLRERITELGRHEFQLVDSAGLDFEWTDRIAEQAALRTREALSDAQVALFVVDGISGPLPLDADIARLLHQIGISVMFCANKIDVPAHEKSLASFSSLGFSEPIPISSAHGLGIDDLLESLRELFEQRDVHSPLSPSSEPSASGNRESEPAIQLTIVGKPNVGKSSIVNALFGDDRQVTGPEPGITRDSVHLIVDRGGFPVELVDTAGIRRKSKIDEPVEKLCVSAGLRELRQAQTVVLVVDACDLTDRMELDMQTRRIGAQVAVAGKPLIIAVNKIDRSPKFLNEDWRRSVRKFAGAALSQMGMIPLVFVSAKSGAGLQQLVQLAVASRDRWVQRIGTAVLNQWLNRSIRRRPPPRAKGRDVSLKYIAQIDSRPPCFAIQANITESDFPESYRRYLIRGLRSQFDFEGIPVSISIRRARNPFLTTARVTRSEHGKSRSDVRKSTRVHQ